MKQNRTLVLLGAILVVMLALVLVDRHRPTTDEQRHTRDRLLPEFARDKIMHLAITLRDGRTVQLIHQADGWWLRDAGLARADDDRVDSLLSVLEYANVERRVGQGDAAKFGLSPALVTLDLEGKRLRIGEDGPGHGVYVQRDGSSEILVAEHRLVEVADLDPGLWLSPHLTLTDPTRAAKIGFGDWTLSREHGWHLTSPVIVRANDDRVDALLQSLWHARGHARKDKDVATRSPVELSVDGKVQAKIGGPCAGETGFVTVLRADAETLCFAATELDTLRAPVTRLYEQRAFPLRLDDVRALDVSVSGRVLSLRRENGIWRVTAPLASVGPASDDKVRAIVQQLVEARARDFSKDAPVGTVARVRLATADETIGAALSTAHGIAVLRREGETLSLEIDPSLVEALLNVDAAQLRRDDGGAR